MSGGLATARRGGRWTDLRKRALSAAILGPVVVACIWLGANAWTAIVALGCAVLAWEWVHLCGRRTRALPGLTVPLAVLGAGALALLDRPLTGMLALLIGFAVAWVAAQRLAAAEGCAKPGEFAAGVLYIGIAAIALIELRHNGEAGRSNVLFLFAVVWATDIGAYAVGRAAGGPKLAPAISPGKTWSGAVGGLLCGVLAGLLVADWVTPGRGIPAVAVTAGIAGLLSVVAQAGDLFESALKRHFGVKDSSALIPGHGGVLDRMDGVLAAAPVAALLHAASPGVPLWS